MADETNVTNVTNNNEVAGNEPTVEQLMADLAAARADAERFKSANDKLSKSEAEMKRQLRAKQTAEEQEAAAKAEAQRLADEERESLKAELNQIRALNAYKEISDEKAVKKLIEAVSNADHSAIAQIISEVAKKAVADAEATWLKERPRVQHGNYSSMTREQIMAISDSDERLKAIALNKHLF